MAIELGFDITVNVIIRLYGINTPELRDKDPEIKAKAYEAKQYLVDKILDKEVIAETFLDKKGKYGRYLSVIYFEDVNINQELVDLGLAVKYMV